MPSLRCLALLVATSPAALTAQATVTVGPSKDNTLYEDPSGKLSNAKGQFLFTGRTGFFGGSKLRRAVLAFGVAARIPKGSKVLGVTLAMTMDRTAFGVGAFPTRLHRLTADWGEGRSKATFNEGGGAPATKGDATWIHRFFSTLKWTKAGGDFVPAASATTTVGAPGTYTWGSTAAMVADVQLWVDKPGMDFGWLLEGDSTGQSAKRWASRENVLAAARPRLTIRFDPKAAVRSVGNGCPKNGRNLVQGASGLPSVGNARFALLVSGGTPKTAGIGFLAAGLQEPPLELNANHCFLYIDVRRLGPSLAAVFGTGGRVVLPLPIPNDKRLLGLWFATQVFAVERNPFALRSSNALVVFVGS